MISEAGDQVIKIMLGEVLDAKIINTEAEHQRPCFMLPKTCGEGAWVVSVGFQGSDKVLIGKDCSLLQAVHSFFNSDIYVAVVCDDGVNRIVFSYVIKEVSRMNSHIFRFLHRRG